MYAATCGLSERDQSTIPARGGGGLPVQTAIGVHCSSHYAVTHVRNKNSNNEGRSTNGLKVISIP